MQFIENNGVKISYKVFGNGQPLLLVHGGFGFKELYLNNGFAEKLRESFLVILIDLRGHGESDKPKNHEEYTLRTLVSDITVLLDQLGISKVHFYGYSLGGWVGMGMAKYASDRLLTLTCGGSQPFDEWWLLSCATWLNEYLKHGKETILTVKNAFKSAIESVAKLPSMVERSDLMLSDIHRLENLEVLKSFIALVHNLEQEHLDIVIQELSIPCFFFGGGSDTGSWVGYERLLRKLKPDAIIETVDGDHIDVDLNYHEILPQLLEFWESE